MVNKELERLLKGYKGTKITFTPNYLKIKVTELDVNEDCAEFFNTLVQTLRDDKRYKDTPRSKSNGISYSKGLESFYPSYSFRYNSYQGELLIMDDMCYRIQFGNHARKQGTSGRKAYTTFMKLAKKYGIDMTNYEVSREEGMKIKEQLPKPSIELAPHEPFGVRPEFIKDRTIRKVCHLDLNSAYPAGIVESYPEFKKMMEYLYNNRKKKPLYKAVMNLTIGFFQSKYCNYKYAKLSDSALTFTRTKVDTMVDNLIKLGYMPLATNTDGVWYIGSELTQDELKTVSNDLLGTELGQWKVDHKNCVVRFKSVGAYEFIEDCEFDEETDEVIKEGNYKAVVRGFTKLDRIKPREEWEWGDIYKEEADILLFTFNSETGIIEKVERK